MMKKAGQALFVGLLVFVVSTPAYSRYFEPETGRFLSEDPIPRAGQSEYAYALGNPLKYSDPTGADVVLVEYNVSGFYHQEVWVGNAASGYVPIGYDPASILGGALSLGTGLSVAGSVQELPRTPNLPSPLFGVNYANLLGTIQEGPAADAAILAYARALKNDPRWQKYNAYRNSCQDYAQTVFGRALQLQRSGGGQ